MLDREASHPDAVVADHDSRSIVQITRNLIEVCEKERCLALWPTCHLASEQHDARLPCPGESEKRTEVRVERHQDPTLFQSGCEHDRVRCALEADISHMDDVVTGGMQQIKDSR